MSIPKKITFFLFLLIFFSFALKEIKIAYAFSMGYHYDLIREAMRKFGFSKDAFSLALAGNSYVDIFQEEATEYVVDDDFCRVSKKIVDFLHFDNLYNKDLINRYFRQLIYNTYNAVSEKVNRNDKLGLLMIIGITSHIIQDFYAHSNWAELNLAKSTKIKDATYFDVLYNSPEIFEKALSEKEVYGQKGLFTHWQCGLSHGTLNKDHAGRSFFDLAYRSSYKATLEWIDLIRKWVVEDLRKESFWNELLRYEFKEGNKKYLYTLTDFDEGTIRWMCTYGGAWKNPKRWGSLDIVFDDMPNVPGIGVASQNSPDYPFLGIEWFSNCTLIAKDMFEAKSLERFIKLDNVENLERGVINKSDFGEIVKVNHKEVSFLEPLNNLVIENAISFLGRGVAGYDDLKWLRIRIPEAQDLDTGEDTFDINNEEPGGTSDYWVMFIVNNEVEYPYTEAEYVDESHPYPVWGILKPLWDKRKVKVEIRMYESDSGLRGSEHKDEEMDISPDNRKALIFEFDPQNLNSPSGCLCPSGVSCFWILENSGRFLKSDGTGDLRARVYVKVWIMKDFEEGAYYSFVYEHKEYAGVSLPLIYNIPDFSEYKFNDKISSIFLPSEGWIIEIYEDINYKGKSLQLSYPTNDLHALNWGDKISSIRIIKRPQNLSSSPTFYEDKNLSGKFLQLPFENPNFSNGGFYSELSPLGFNDRISSIFVPKDWTVIIFEHPHFEGKSLTLTTSENDLSRLGWNDRISSVRIIPPLTLGTSELEDFDKITLSDILKIPLSSTPINGSNNLQNQLTPGTILVYKTNEGRYGKMQIISYGYDIYIK